MELSNEHRRFLLIEQCAIPTICNFVMNGAIAWVVHFSSATVSIANITSDLFLTSFLLPFIICLVVSSLVAGKVRSGKIPLLPTHQFPHWRWFRRSSSQRGLLLGMVGVLFGAIPVIWALSLGQAQPFTVSSFVLFKAVWAAMLASLVTPIVGWWALANASHLQASKNHR